MARKIAFTIFGSPTGKARPRFARRGKKVVVFTPEATANFETLVKWSFANEVKLEAPFDGQVEIEVYSYFAKPKSWSKKKMSTVPAPPVLVKPDVDNLLKAVLDGLSGVAYLDDRQVWKATVTKEYSNLPRTVVTIWLGEGY